MTIHLFSSDRPVCGAMVKPAEGGPVTEAYFRDLCRPCRDWLYYRGKKLQWVERAGHPPQKKRKGKGR